MREDYFTHCDKPHCREEAVTLPVNSTGLQYVEFFKAKLKNRKI